MMALIFIESSIPGDRFPELQFRLADKVVHFFIFGILGILIARSFRFLFNPVWKNNYILWSIAIGIIYGLIDEWHQMYIPGRYASIGDWIADLLGIVCFVLLYFWWLSKRIKSVSLKVEK